MKYALSIINKNEMIDINLCTKVIKKRLSILKCNIV